VHPCVREKSCHQKRARTFVSCHSREPDSVTLDSPVLQQKRKWKNSLHSLLPIFHHALFTCEQKEQKVLSSKTMKRTRDNYLTKLLSMPLIAGAAAAASARRRSISCLSSSVHCMVSGDKIHGIGCFRMQNKHQ
jgi:hypothetical protein